MEVAVEDARDAECRGGLLIPAGAIRVAVRTRETDTAFQDQGRRETVRPVQREALIAPFRDVDHAGIGSDRPTVLSKNTRVGVIELEVAVLHECIRVGPEAAVEPDIGRIRIEREQTG